MKYTFIFFLIGALTLQAQNFWQKTNADKIQSTLDYQEGVPLSQLYQLDLENFSTLLYNLGENDKIDLVFPDLNGKLITYTVQQYSNFEADLQAQYPQICSYVGTSPEDQGAYLRFSIDPKGISAMIIRPDNKSQYIEKVTEEQEYAVYHKRILPKNLQRFECLTEDTPIDNSNEPQQTTFSNNGIFKTFRIAISTDGQYTQYHGGTVEDALAAVNTTLTRVNGIYEVDLAVHLNLVANSTDVMYTNPNTDPYTSDVNTQLQTTLNNIIGSSNYDVGHLLSAAGGGGNAGCIGCVCNFNKGSGYSASYSPVGDYFDVDYVAHEIGHQLGANHSFSWNPGENTNYNVEPGSGSTIMGYAGITGSTNVQAHSDPYFVYRNIEQIQGNLANKACANNVQSSNGTPSVTGENNYSIPKGTPFKLEGSATDDQQGSLTYNWEEDDDANASGLGSGSFPSPEKVSGPNFRSVGPTTSPVRYFPDLTYVLAGNLCPQWECISETSRSLRFAFTARDNQPEGQTNTAITTLSVQGSMGPFLVTGPDLTNTIPVGGNVEVTWDVANTNNSPINCQLVNILISTDGGETFTMVAENTPNDGSEEVSLSGLPASLDCIAMVEAADNVFFNVSDNFYIGYQVTEDCNTFTYDGDILPITDNTNSYTTDAHISVTAPTPSDATISSVTAYVDVTHTYIQDLQIRLLSPNSMISTLWNRQCNDHNNMQVTFDDNGTSVVCANPVAGTYRPSTPLNIFDGQIQTGTWRIQVGDYAFGDSGAFVGGSLNICSITVEELAVDDVEQKDLDFTIYPNPASDVVKIQSDFEFKDFRIYNPEGRLISQGTLTNNEININSLPAGAYFLQLNGTNKEYKVRSFLVER